MRLKLLQGRHFVDGRLIRPEDEDPIFEGSKGLLKKFPNRFAPVFVTNPQKDFLDDDNPEESEIEKTESEQNNQLKTMNDGAKSTGQRRKRHSRHRSQ